MIILDPWKECHILLGNWPPQLAPRCSVTKQSMTFLPRKSTNHHAWDLSLDHLIMCKENGASVLHLIQRPRCCAHYQEVKEMGEKAAARTKIWTCKCLDSESHTSRPHHLPDACLWLSHRHSELVKLQMTLNKNKCQETVGILSLIWCSAYTACWIKASVWILLLNLLRPYVMPHQILSNFGETVLNQSYRILLSGLIQRGLCGWEAFRKEHHRANVTLLLNTVAVCPCAQKVKVSVWLPFADQRDTVLAMLVE